MEFLDYYKALGVKRSASQDEIKRAYQKLARQHHPDVNPDDLTAERRFKEVNEANEVLGDPEKRRKYDDLGANWRMYDQAGPSGSPFTGQWSTSASGGYSHDIFGGGSPSSDFFQTFFTGGNPGVRPGGAPTRGRDVEQPITLTLEEAYKGTTRRLRLATGSGTEQLEVRIPPGVDDGSRVRVAGKGQPGNHGSRSGDLLLLVRLSPHPVFSRQAQDLHVDVQTPVTTAVLGGQVEVHRLHGEPLTLKIPPATQSGQVFRLKGHGMPALSGARNKGDLYATVSVRLPDRLTTEQRRHYEALAALGDESVGADLDSE